MDEATIALIITSAGIFSVFIGLFFWGLATGQFRNVEEPKYRIFDAEDLGVFKVAEDGEDEKKEEEANG